MKTKQEVTEWLRGKGVLNKFIRNMKHYNRNLTLDLLLNSWQRYDIIMFAFGWTRCNDYFNDNTDWCLLSNEYIKWYKR